MGKGSDSSNKHVLVASFGYMRGKPSFFWPFASFRSTTPMPNTVFLTFATAEGCEAAKSSLKANYRDELFNSACIVMPASGQIMQSDTISLK